MGQRVKDVYICDFETSVYNEITDNDIEGITTDFLEEVAEVWAVGVINLNGEGFKYYNNIYDFIEFMACHEGRYYFHNLKFDGQFILNTLFQLNFKYKNKKPKELENNEFTTLISDMGAFYSIDIKLGESKIQIWDSLKLLPRSVEKLSKDFGLEVTKGEIDYNRPRRAYENIPAEEVDYLYRDCKVVSECLKQVFSLGITEMTQGGAAIKWYKKSLIGGEKTFRRLFPKLSMEEDELVRRSYKGGYAYVNPRYQGKDIEKGVVYDKNSMYPWVMVTFPLPYGEGIPFTGKYEEDKEYNLYVQEIIVNFELKSNGIPMIQFKNSGNYNPTKYVETTNGNDEKLVITNIDLELFIKNYNIINIEYIKGYKYKSSSALFKKYVKYWYERKSKAAKEGNLSLKFVCKLMLNSLYGKFGTRPSGRSKLPFYDEGVKYLTSELEERESVYIPIAAFITAYARSELLQRITENYERFLYCDTDSLHLLGDKVPNLEIDKYKLGYWDHELTFERARFLNAKRYIEESGGKLKVTCAGMPSNCHKSVTWENFKIGTKYSGKLTARQIRGGVVLKETTFEIRDLG